MTPNILIVEDTEYDRILYKEYLDDSKFTFDELDDGDQVMIFLENNQPDLILLDWQMPRKSGLETLKLLKETHYSVEIPVIIITGLNDEKVLEKAFSYGGTDFLYKPVSRSELNSRVSSALNLSNAKKKLIEQNQIISNQKKELEKNFKLQEELNLLKQKGLQEMIKKTKSTMMTLEMKTTKVNNKLNEILKLTTQALDEVKKENIEQSTLLMNKIKRQIQRLQSDEENMEELKSIFESFDPNFISNLTSHNSKLTPLDIKHCVYIKMNLSNHEIAHIFNIELSSLHMTRYRLRKKLKLKEETLQEFVLSI